MDCPHELHTAFDMNDYSFNVIGEIQAEAEAVLGGRRVEVWGLPGGDGRFYATLACKDADDLALLREWCGRG